MPSGIGPVRPTGAMGCGHGTEGQYTVWAPEARGRGRGRAPRVGRRTQLPVSNRRRRSRSSSYCACSPASTAAEPSSEIRIRSATST